VRLIGESDATGPIPLPDRETEGGVPVALLLSVSVPVRVPRTAGTKTTLTVQVPPAERAAGQLFVCAKFPDVVKLVMERVPDPVFVRVTFCGLLVVPMSCEAKVRELGFSEALSVYPMPDKATVCGLPASGASSAIDKVPVRVPEAVGVNVTLMVQFAPAAKEPGQLLVCAKSPPVEMDEILSETLPLLVRVTDCELAVVPTSWLAKLRELTERATADAPPVPLRVKEGGFPARLLFKVSVPLTGPWAVGEKVTLTAQLTPEARKDPQLLV